MNKKLILIGASGHGKVIADIARNNGYSEIAFLDDNKEKTHCGSCPVIGIAADAEKYRDYDFIVSVGNADAREGIQKRLLELGVNVVTLVHPAAVVAEDVTLGVGTVVMAGAVINPGTVVGNGAIINTCSSVDHDCEISDYVHVSVGAHVAGNVRIGKKSWIGAGATVINNVEITADCMIGAGATVVRSALKKGVYKGVPARLSEK